LQSSTSQLTKSFFSRQLIALGLLLLRSDIVHIQQHVRSCFTHHTRQLKLISIYGYGQPALVTLFGQCATGHGFVENYWPACECEW